jgi:hypothetical protein
MKNVHKFSEQLIELATRLDDIGEAAEGKGGRRARASTRWLLLPTVGAGVYALLTSKSFGRQAKGVIDQAKTRASELPEDLMNRARGAKQQPSRSGSRSGQNGSTRKRSTAKRASSARSSSSSH